MSLKKFGIWTRIISETFEVWDSNWFTSTGTHKPSSDYDLVFSTEVTKNQIDIFKENNIEFRHLGNSASGCADRHTMFNEYNRF